ncbi:MAG: SCO family protein [Bacteroidales bacterium]|nr:SCO family protein [Bacteroidales bacterium]
MVKLLFFLLTIIILSAKAQEQKLYEDLRQPEIGVVEKLDTYISEDIMVIDENNQAVSLRSLIDKPTVLNLVYYRCPGICSPIMESIANVVDKTDMIPGKDFQVLTISFDPTESTELAQQKRNNYFYLIKREFDPNGWRFFTADSTNAINLTEQVGFKYKKVGFDYIHTASIIVLSPQGKITRYLQGVFYLPFDVKMAVVEAAEGKSGPSISRVLAYCYAFDPAGQRYVFDITKIAGTLILFFSAVIFLFLLIRYKTKKPIPKV